MLNKILLIIFTICAFSFSYSQVKIGDNPSQIDSFSVLELESRDKFIVITRMSSSQMLASTPLEGAMVYNIDLKCVYVYRNPSWKSLCEAANIYQANVTPSNPNLGDLWVDGDTTYGWNGSKWIVISKSVINGNGLPNTNVTNPKAGDLYVDSSTGDIYTYNGLIWVNQAQVEAENGLTYNKTTNTIGLGGALTKPTKIITNNTNTISVEGLPKGNIEKEAVVTVDRQTGQLKKVLVDNLLNKEEFVITIDEGKEGVKVIQLGNNGKKLKSTKVDVYRNGVKIGVSVDVTNNRITIIEKEAYCCTEDKLRIVQFY